jgi:hypothetical protein
MGTVRVMIRISARAWTFAGAPLSNRYLVDR